MPLFLKNAITFDDVLLVPQYSDISSRKNVSIATALFGTPLGVPICSANMDTITEFDMAWEMDALGGFGILHRYAPHDVICHWIHSLKKLNARNIIPSIGIKSSDVALALHYAELGITGITVDIAHGDSKHMVEMIHHLKSANLKVIAGNVASYDGALRLADAGADVIKVGIGGGSMCTTRIVTGHGVPQLSAIEECAKIKRLYPHVGIIADGGIRNSGDCVKALAFGADICMVGSLLAGTQQTPGCVIEKRDSLGKMHKVKQYRGMASAEARGSFVVIDSSYTAEGVATTVPYKGSASSVINQLIGGISSGLSYSGAKTLKELRDNSEYVFVTGSSLAESKPHGLKS